MGRVRGIPEGGDGREIGGGGHDGEGDKGEGELKEAKEEAAEGARHALKVVEGVSGHCIVGEWWGFHWVNRWVNHRHHSSSNSNQTQESPLPN